MFNSLERKHAHWRALGFFVLRTFILAAGNKPGWKMRDAHRGISGIYVLSTLAAGAVSIHPQLFRLDDDLNAVVNFRRT